MQARMSSGDNRLYSPARDVAHNFQEVAKIVASRLEDGIWPELSEVLEREGVTMDELGEACGAFCRYVSSAAESPSDTMADSMRKSGLFDIKPGAQVAVFATLGVCFAGIQYAGIREATVDGEGPLNTVKDLGVHAKKFRDELRRPPAVRFVRRKLRTFWSKLKVIFG